MATEYVDITPTWSQIVPALVLLLQKGNAEGKKLAVEELNLMAQLADIHIANLKAKIAA